MTSARACLHNHLNAGFLPAPRADNDLATFTAGKTSSATAAAEAAPVLYLDSDGEMENDDINENISNYDQIEGWTYSDDVQDKGRTWTHAEDRFLWQIYKRYNEDELADIAKLVRNVLVVCFWYFCVSPLFVLILLLSISKNILAPHSTCTWSELYDASFQRRLSHK